MKKYKLPIKYSNLSIQERKEVRAQYEKEQKGLCFFCKCRLDEKPPQKILNKIINWNLFPINFLKQPIHLQHNHVTGMTEGAVHSYCNAVMWQYYNK